MAFPLSRKYVSMALSTACPGDREGFTVAAGNRSARAGGKGDDHDPKPGH